MFQPWGGSSSKWHFNHIFRKPFQWFSTHQYTMNCTVKWWLHDRVFIGSYVHGAYDSMILCSLLYRLNTKWVYLGQGDMQDAFFLIHQTLWEPSDNGISDTLGDFGSGTGWETKDRKGKPIPRRLWILVKTNCCPFHGKGIWSRSCSQSLPD